MSAGRRRAWAWVTGLLLVPAPLHAQTTLPPQSFDSQGILSDPPLGYHIESVRVRFTHYQQTGRGYQSRAGELLGPGSEWARIEQPQAEVVATQGDTITHRLWVPVDVVTAASPDAVDAVSSASRVNEAMSLDLTSTYHPRPDRSLGLRVGFHAEEPFRSWNIGLGGSRSLAEDNTVLSANVNQVVDWFDSYDLHGGHLDRVSRSTTNANVAVTQLLSATTIAVLNYGLTLQTGELSNTWNSVPLDSGDRGTERLPRFRQRHALVARVLQWLPWQGALKTGYRFYADDWQVVAHTFDVELDQRLGRGWSVAANYRLHHQSGVGFFTTLAPDVPTGWRTADSDLARLWAQTIGGKVAAIVWLARGRRALSIDWGFDHYFRSNGLRANVYTCSLALQF